MWRRTGLVQVLESSPRQLAAGGSTPFTEADGRSDVRNNGSSKPHEHERPYAVLIGMDCTTALQVARVLHDRGVPVIGIAADPRHPCCRTNACEQILAADTSTTEFLDLLVELGPSLDRKAVLIPCTDMSVLLLSRHRQRVEEWYHVALPAQRTIDLLLDKSEFYSFAQAEGFPIPRTVFLRDRGDLARAEMLRFPCIIKPAVKTPEWLRNMRSKVLIVQTPEELRPMYERSSPHTPALVLQEWVEGEDANLYTCNCYFDASSRPLVTFVSRKLRQWPPRAGVGSVSVEVRHDAVAEHALRLFQRVDFHGFGYLETKYDRDTGRDLIIEANVGRPTGRSAMAEGCGVEYHYTMYCDVLGLPLPEQRQQRFTDTRWIYLRRDLQASAYYLWHRKLTVREWWKDMRGPKVFAVWSRKDPVPFLEDLRQKIAQVVFRKNRMPPQPRERNLKEWNTGVR